MNKRENNFSWGYNNTGYNPSRDDCLIIFQKNYFNFDSKDFIDLKNELKRELKEELSLKNVTIKHLDTIIYPYNRYIFNIYLIEDNVNIEDLVYNSNEIINVKWYTKEKILNKIKNGKINKGYAYILENYIND